MSLRPDDKRMFELAYLQHLHKERFGEKPKVDIETKYEQKFEEEKRTKDLLKKWKPVLDKVVKEFLPAQESSGESLPAEENS